MKEYYIKTIVFGNEYYVEVTKEQWEKYINDLAKDRIYVSVDNVREGEMYLMEEGEYEADYFPHTDTKYHHHRGGSIGYVHETEN